MSIMVRPECFNCREELDSTDNPDMGECPRCGRKMKYKEWRVLGEELGYYTGEST